MAKLTLAAAAVALLIGQAVQANAQPYPGYLPPPAYAYADRGAPIYQDESETPGGCGGSGFTILGVRAGATVLGFDAGVGGHFGFSGGCHRRGSVPVLQAYAPPPPPPQAYEPPYQGPPYPQMYYAPPPPPPASYSPGPCGC
jgi:hypothetical protein